MNLKLALCIPLAAAAVGPGGAVLTPGDDVGFHVQSGTSLARSFESRQEVSQDEVEMLLNGQPLPAGSENGMTLIQAQALEIVDEFVTVEGAQPLRLKRSFQKIESSGEQTTQNPMDAGQQDDAVQAHSELEGKTVVFEWDASKQQFQKHFEPEGPDEKLLLGLVEDVDFRAFLPASGQASPDDHWKVDVAAMAGLFLPGGDLALKPEETTRDGEDSASAGMFDANPAEAFSGLEGEVAATYLGSREIGGVTCGVISLEFKVHSNRDLSDRLSKSKDGSGASDDVKVERVSAFLSLEGEAELTWDLAAGHARSFTLSAKIKNQMDVAMKIGSGDKPMDIQRKMQMSGTYELKAAITAR